MAGARTAMIMSSAAGMGETVSSKGKTTSAMDQSALRGPTKVGPGVRTNALTKAAAAKLMI